MPVTYLTGNIVHDDADLIVNTVNTVGVMGKGVALAFRDAFPQILAPYRQACRSGDLVAGGCLVMPTHNPARPEQHWAALATKADWRDQSQLEWIASGLTTLAHRARELGVRSIACPPPGCGNGGLDWSVVEPIVLDVLRNFDLRLYARPSRT